MMSIASIRKGSVAVHTITLLMLLTPFQTAKYTRAQPNRSPANTGQEIPPISETLDERFRTVPKKKSCVFSPHERVNAEAK